MARRRPAAACLISWKACHDMEWHLSNPQNGAHSDGAISMQRTSQHTLLHSQCSRSQLVMQRVPGSWLHIGAALSGTAHCVTDSKREGHGAHGGGQPCSRGDAAGAVAGKDLATNLSVASCGCTRYRCRSQRKPKTCIWPSVPFSVLASFTRILKMHLYRNLQQLWSWVIVMFST